MAGDCPKLEVVLTRADLQDFIEMYEFWCNAKEMTDKKMKMLLFVQVHNKSCREYLSINKKKIQDDNVTWDAFKKSFIEECAVYYPDEFQNIYDIFTINQPANMRTSVFTQKVRYLIGDAWTAEKEKEFIALIVRRFQPQVKDFIYLRGTPANYDELITLIQAYENECEAGSSPLKRGVNKIMLFDEY